MASRMFHVYILELDNGSYYVGHTNNLQRRLQEHRPKSHALISSVVYWSIMSSTHFHPLTPEEERVIVHGGTEPPGSGEYDAFFADGMYVCRRCSAPLFDAKAKFDAGCGWPSFDEEMPGAVTRIPDRDGLRTEIRCASCDGHLGHVFAGENMTAKDTRHCVNSLSLRFVPRDQAA